MTPKAAIPYVVAVVGAVSFGLPFATHTDPFAGVVTGLACIFGGVVLAHRAGQGGWRIAFVALFTIAITAIGGGEGVHAWLERTRRDVTRDERYRTDGVLVHAHPSPSTAYSADGGVEYWATMFVDPVRSGFRGQTGVTDETVDGQLLTTERHDLTPALLGRLQQAVDDRVDVDILVLTTTVRDPFGRARLDGYRLPDEIGWVDPLQRLGPTDRAVLDQIVGTVGDRRWDDLSAPDRAVLEATGPLEDLMGVRFLAVDRVDGRFRVSFEAVRRGGERVPGVLER